MRLLLLLIRFELGQQVRGHVFWIVFAVSALMVAGALWIPELRVGIAGDIPALAPATIVRTHLIWSLFYMFTAAAFGADAVLRDALSGFDPIIRSTPVPRRLLLLARFAGGFAATALCFLSVPAAMLLLTLDPAIGWGDLHPPAFATGLVVLALPNLFTSAVFFFVLATWMRSLLGALAGAVALLSLYGLGAEPGSGQAWALVEPFGFAASAAAGPGLLLANRALWLALSLAALAALLLAPPREERPPKKAAAPADKSAPPPAALPLPLPRFGPAATFAMFAHRARFELRQLLASPAFAILLIMGLGNAAATIWRLLVADPSADAQGIVGALIDAFDLVPVVVAIFFAGELAWNERDHRVQDLIGASAMPNTALLVPKLMALGLALLMLALASAGAAVAVPQFLGRSGPSPLELAFWYVIPRSIDWLLLGTLALFFQAISPNKLAGWGWAVLYLIVSLALDQAGYRDPIHHYGRYPGYPFPALLSGAAGTGWYLFYWAALALLLLILADSMASRGAPMPFATRLAMAARRLRGARAWFAALAALAFIGLGFALAVTPD